MYIMYVRIQVSFYQCITITTTNDFYCTRSIKQD